MLVTFSCKHYHNVVFFGDVALKLLHCMGHSGTVPGALLAGDVPLALSLLQQAVLLDDSQESDVTFVNRARPLIELLQYAVQHKANVLWE